MCFGSCQICYFTVVVLMLKQAEKLLKYFLRIKIKQRDKVNVESLNVDGDVSTADAADFAGSCFWMW